MKKIFKKIKLSTILYIFIGIVCGSAIGVSAATILSAEEVYYSNDNASVTTVKDALDDLINRVNNLGRDEEGRYYLYDEGDEYTEITGGWGEHIGVNNGQNVVTGWLTKNTDHMEMKTKIQGSLYPNYTTNKKVDLTGYKFVGIEYSFDSAAPNGNLDSLGFSSYIMYSSALTGVSSTTPSDLPYYWKSQPYRLIECEDDKRVIQYYPINTTSTLTGGYLTISPVGYYTNTTIRVYKIWLQ